MRKSFIVVLLSVILSASVAFVVVKANNKQFNEFSEPNSLEPTYRTVNLSLSDYPDFTYAAENAVDAVVYIKVTVKSNRQNQYIDPFFQFFFGDEGYGGTRERIQQGSGSGVIIRKDGYIVTNNHVVAGATEVEVSLNNDKTYTAQVIGTDPATDVALIKIDADNLPTIQFADSDKLRLGEWVLAIGSPLGKELQSTITAGIVSAKGRNMPNYDGEFKIESFIQTDAAVNPGNSGGALVNKKGELIGINTAIVSTTGSYTGYSFAVPSNVVKKIVSDLIDFGSVKRAKLGISMQEIDQKLADEMKLSSTDGVYIFEVQKASAADKAGLKKGDVIISIDDAKVRKPSEVQVKVNNYHPGDKAKIKYLRDNKENTVEVVFQGDEPVENGTVAEDGTISFYGASLKAAEKGVLIVSAGNGKLAQAGAEDGFTILYVNDQKVSKPEDVVNIAKKSKRSIFIEGITASGRPGYFGFGKE